MTGTTEAATPPKMPAVRAVSFGDISAALWAGLADFMRAPLFGLFFGGVFAAGGLFILAALYVFEMPWMIIPVAIGFPLIGPFVAVGLYEVSRRLSSGRPLIWREVLLVVFRQRETQLGWMAFVVLFIFWMWIYQVRLLFALFLGFKSISGIGRFIEVTTMSAEGLGFLAVGTAFGAALAFVLFSATVIAMPLLLDRELDFVSAMITSFKTVLKSPLPMISWGILITVLAVVAMLPAFLGMIVILPVLGHATWHLYERAIGSQPA
ncbi:MAG: DUF2189 domain-containing protein [Rhizobiaceae bacterium]|nr:DUF2189 domain-containing protein [Rhizobiaceae bacterium]